MSPRTSNLIQHIVTIIGGLLVGLGVTSDTTWETISGIIAGVISVIWAFKSKTETSAQVAGIVKQVLQFVGAFFVTKGAITQDKLMTIIAAVVSAVTLVVDQIADANNPTAPTTTTTATK